MKGLTTDEYEILEACTLPDSDAGDASGAGHEDQHICEQLVSQGRASRRFRMVDEGLFVTYDATAAGREALRIVAAIQVLEGA